MCRITTTKYNKCGHLGHAEYDYCMAGGCGYPFKFEYTTTYLHKCPACITRAKKQAVAAAAAANAAANSSRKKGKDKGTDDIPDEKLTNAAKREIVQELKTKLRELEAELAKGEIDPYGEELREVSARLRSMGILGEKRQAERKAEDEAKAEREKKKTATKPQHSKDDDEKELKAQSDTEAEKKVEEQKKARQGQAGRLKWIGVVGRKLPEQKEAVAEVEKAEKEIRKRHEKIVNGWRLIDELKASKKRRGEIEKIDAEEEAERRRRRRKTV